MTIAGVHFTDVAFVLLAMPSAMIKVVSGYKKQLRVYNGRNVSYEEYPYVMVLAVKISKFNKLWAERTCTCSIIKPAWVLSAAHCLYINREMIIPLSFLKVIYGDLTIPLNITTSETEVQEAFVHPRYTKSQYIYHNNILRSKRKNDIALLKIIPVDVKPLAKLSAVDYHALIGYHVTYLGAGNTYSLSDYIGMESVEDIIEEDGTRPLQIGEAAIVDCNNQFSDVYPRICIVSKCSNPSQIMHGDSGGPLLFRGKIIGVANSYSLLALSASQRRSLYQKDIGPVGAVFTAISPYLDWIGNVISNNTK